MSFDEAWTELAPAVRRSLERASDSLVAGGLPVGSVLTDAHGDIVVEGRNRAYDPPGGTKVGAGCGHDIVGGDSARVERQEILNVPPPNRAAANDENIEHSREGQARPF